jgi:hypothetical protein
MENRYKLKFVFSFISYFGIANSINRLYNLNKSLELHKMPITSPNIATPLTSARPFSFTNSESGYKKDKELKGL